MVNSSGIEPREQVGAGLNARWDEAEQFDIELANFFNLFIGDLTFGELGRG
jgi:hypothetical protein